MADNVTLNAPTVGGGSTIASDDIGGLQFQRIKLVYGADGVNSGDVSATNPLPARISFGDVAQLDSFSRLRVSNPDHVFDGQLTYDLAPLLYEAITVTGGGGVATVEHSSTNRCAAMTFTAALTGCKAIMQTYQYFPYQPGRSQLIFVTFNMVETTANVLKFAGYSDGVNGIEFQLNGTAVQFVVYSSTSNGNQTALQADWNVDKLDGTGTSGITLDITKTQILVIDLQALYVGRVRVGFDIGGQIIIAHQFVHSNSIASPYIATANLPVRCGMTGTATVTTTMQFICCSVISEGGNPDNTGFDFSQSGSVTAASGARTHLLSIQKKTTFNSLTNRGKVVLAEVDLLVTGNSPVKWELVLGDVITGTTTFNDVNTTYSAMQYNTAGTTSAAPLIVVATGYVAASNSSKGTIASMVPSRYPMSLDAAGAVRTAGRYSILVTGIGGTSACQGSIGWREVR
jgi:hypothetical protein